MNKRIAVLCFCLPILLWALYSHAHGGRLAKRVAVIRQDLSAYRSAFRHRQPAPVKTGKLQDPRLDEISGVAVSGSRQDILYVHNDSGDTSRFFAIDPQGELKAIYYFKGTEKGLGVKDCEDIAIGAGEEAGHRYVYLGDIGDNKARRKWITIYRVEEPDVPGRPGPGKDGPVDSKGPSIAKTSVVNASVLKLVYPDGPRDAETLMVDPVDKLLYIISKREDSVGIYTIPWHFPAKGMDEVASGTAKDVPATGTLVLQKRGRLHFVGLKPFKWITAGDISRDGQQVLLKNYTQVYYWKREGREPLWRTLQRIPRQLPYTLEKQGEAIGFTPDGKGYYTTSEGVHAPIYYYTVGF